jgi:predicted membrane metal-binding protein
LAQAAQLTIYSDGSRQIIDNARAALGRELKGNANANSQTLQAPENYTRFALAAWYFYQQSVFFDAGQSQHVEALAIRN